jgi:hypothetical protein
MSDTIDQLAAVLAKIDGPINRKKLITERKRIKASRKRDPFDLTELPGQTPDLGNSVEVANSPIAQSDDEVFRIVLIDLQKAGDIAALAKDYVVGGEPAVLKVGDRLSHDATVVIIFRMRDVCSIAGKLSYWRKGRLDRVFLFKPKMSSEISDETAIAVCGKREADAIDKLLFASMAPSALQLCQELLSGLGGRRLHLFAEMTTLGWDSIVDEEIGIQRP